MWSKEHSVITRSVNILNSSQLVTHKYDINKDEEELVEHKEEEIRGTSTRTVTRRNRKEKIKIRF